MVSLGERIKGKERQVSLAILLRHLTYNTDGLHNLHLMFAALLFVTSNLTFIFRSNYVATSIRIRHSLVQNTFVNNKNKLICCCYLLLFFTSIFRCNYVACYVMIIFARTRLNLSSLKKKKLSWNAAELIHIIGQVWLGYSSFELWQ